MPIKSIVIVIEPPKDVEAQNRVLMFDRETKQWTSNEGGLFSGEIALINAINKARQDITV
jgi:hypothetical protein